MFRKNSKQRRSKIKNYNVVVIGSGAREHAIVDKFSEDNRIINIYVLPGNEGMKGRKIKIKKNIITKEEILLFCKKNFIDLVFVGPEIPLVEGLVDLLQQNNIKAFGPTKINAQLEGSKIISKTIMKKYNIPTAEYKTYNSYEEICSDIRISDNDIVIKYDGLAAGKGVYLPNSQEESLQIALNIFKRKIFSKTPSVLIEKRLKGVECSLIGFCNGKEILFMPQAQDYKKKNDNDEGPNTGGMGSIAPVHILTDVELTYIKSLLDKLVLDTNYKGILYTGLMKTTDGIYVLEFNCRLGDPEAQVLLNLLDTNLYDICIDCIKGKKLNITWNNKCCINLVLSHECYPYDKSSSLLEIKNIENVPKSLKIYYSNVVLNKKKLCTNGGRVLSLVSIEDNLSKCFTELYGNINITYNNIYYRKDIGYKYIQNMNKKILQPQNLNYKESGVDIEKGNKFIKIIKSICNDNEDRIGGFSGIIEYKGIKLAATADGVGTKLEIAKKLNKYDTIGIDLVAMCVNDLIVQGAKPLLFLDYFATGKLDLNMGRYIIIGINDGCNKANCKLIGGETAEMPITYSEDNFDLAGFSLGIIEDDIYPKEINEGDIIYGLKSNGVHSNGFTLINNLLNYYEYDLEELLIPTKIYVNEIEEITKSLKKYVKGFSHITGGGIIDNINRLLRNDLNIKITETWNIPSVFKWIYKNSAMNIEDMLNTYNCGIGMAVILDKNIKNEYDSYIKIIKSNELINLGEIIKDNKADINYHLIKKNFE